MMLRTKRSAGSRKEEDSAEKGGEAAKDTAVSSTAEAEEEGDDAEDEEESESTNEVPVKEPEAFRPFFVNESLEEETEKTAEVEAGGGDDHNPLEDGAKNPLEDDSVGNPLDDDATNPLDEDPLNAVETTPPLNTEVRSNPLGLDYGSDDSNSKSETGSTEQSQPQAQMNEEDKLLATVTCDDAAEEP